MNTRNAHSANMDLSRILVAADDEALINPTYEYIRSLVGDLVDIDMAPQDRMHDVIRLAESRGAAMIAIATHCEANGRVDPDCMPSQLALNSTIPVLILRVRPGESLAFTPVTRILVPLDGSPRAAEALPVATRMATRLGVRVQFVMVIDPSRVIPPAYAYDPDAWSVISVLQETAHWALKQAEEHMTAAGVDVESSLLFGPVNAVLQESIAPGDVVVMTTHGTGRAAQDKLGSVAARIVASAAVPVVIMRGGVPGDIVVDGYQACSWVEPLSRGTRISRT